MNTNSTVDVLGAGPRMALLLTLLVTFVVLGLRVGTVL